MAPEMLTQKGHSLTIDYYSLGALLYEMVTGLPPYYSKNRDQMYYQILHCNLPLVKTMSPELQQLLIGLLTKNPQDRLGAKYGVGEIKQQDWCADIKWDQYLRREVKPPFCVSVFESNFDTEYMLNAVRNRDPEEHSCSYFDSAFQSQDLSDNVVSKEDLNKEIVFKEITKDECKQLPRSLSPLDKVEKECTTLPTQQDQIETKKKASSKQKKNEKYENPKKGISKKNLLLSNIHNLLPTKINSELKPSISSVMYKDDNHIRQLSNDEKGNLSTPKCKANKNTSNSRKTQNHIILHKQKLQSLLSNTYFNSENLSYPHTQRGKQTQISATHKAAPNESNISNKDETTPKARHCFCRIFPKAAKKSGSSLLCSQTNLFRQLNNGYRTCASHVRHIAHGLYKSKMSEFQKRNFSTLRLSKQKDKEPSLDSMTILTVRSQNKPLHSSCYNRNIPSQVAHFNKLKLSNNTKEEKPSLITSITSRLQSQISRPVPSLSPYFSHVGDKQKSAGKCSSSLHIEAKKKKYRINLQINNIVKNATLKLALKAYNNSIDGVEEKKKQPKPSNNINPHSPRETKRTEDIKTKLNKEIIQRISTLQLHSSRKPKISFPSATHKTEKSDKNSEEHTRVHPKTSRKAALLYKQSLAKLQKDISIRI